MFNANIEIRMETNSCVVSMCLSDALKLKQNTHKLAHLNFEPSISEPKYKKNARNEIKRYLCISNYPQTELGHTIP